MIIVTADDYGKSSHATDAILDCFSNRRITSASAMVFMEDSQRAASLALQTDMEVGLHINFTMPFSTTNISSKMREHHDSVISYLTKSKLAQILYNPRLAHSFQYLFKTQEEEFIRLYGKNPTFYNGHHHMHLSMNILMGGILSPGMRVRRTFTFNKAEKGAVNRLYRGLLDAFTHRRFITTDSFYSILPLDDFERLKSIFTKAATDNIEIEVHPENPDEFVFLHSNQYRELIHNVHVGRFQDISN